MFRLRKFLPLMAVLVGAVILGTPSWAHAAFAIRVTEFDGKGKVEASFTVKNAGGPGTAFTANFDAAHKNALPDFNVEVVTNTSTTGAGFSRHDTTITVTYKTGAPITAGKTVSDRLLVEVLGDSYVNPSGGILSQIESSGSTSSAKSLNAKSLDMTSGVLSGNVALSGTPGTTLGGQLGMTKGAGSIPNGASFLTPNPVDGAKFNIPVPKFTFYQTYLIKDVTKVGTASITGATEVDAVVPAPAGLLLALSGLPIFGCYGWLRRRKTVQTA